MIPVNRDTLMMIATLVCAAGIIFLFKEMNKTKKDMDNFKSFSEQVVKHLKPPPQVIESEPEPETLEVIKEEKTTE
jgi:hypothetical protein